MNTHLPLGNIFPAFSLVKLGAGSSLIDLGTTWAFTLTLGQGWGGNEKQGHKGRCISCSSLSSLWYYPLLKLPSQSLNTLKKKKLPFLCCQISQTIWWSSTCNSLRTPSQPTFLSLRCIAWEHCCFASS